MLYGWSRQRVRRQWLMVVEPYAYCYYSCMLLFTMLGNRVAVGLGPYALGLGLPTVVYTVQL